MPQFTMKFFTLTTLAALGTAALVVSCSDAPTDNPAAPVAAVTSYDVSGIPADQPKFPVRRSEARLLSTLLPNIVENPGFEENAVAGATTITDWGVYNAGSLYFYLQTGTSSPTGYFTVPAPPEGSFAAMSDQYGHGVHVLYQDIDVPAGGATLTFKLFIGNRNSSWVVANTLSYNSGPNQQFRMDIMDPDAAMLSIASGDVLLNVYQTNSPQPTVMSGYTTVTADLDAFAGQTVRLRFVEVDNQWYFQAGIDEVIVTPKANIDIKPEDDPNVINTRANGTLTVAILTDDHLDAADVDVSTVRLGNSDGTGAGVILRNNGTYQAALEDVDSDGDDDLVMHFSIPTLVNGGYLTTTSTALYLIGATDADVIFGGWDSVSPR